MTEPPFDPPPAHSFRAAACPMDREPTNRRVLMWSVVGGLILWGLLLGLGSYLGLDPETPDHDIRRMLIVTGSVAIFLAVWMAALWLRGRR
jgi:membrane protein DedA with SNARE-associated domain